MHLLPVQQVIAWDSLLLWVCSLCICCLLIMFANVFFAMTRMVLVLLLDVSLQQEISLPVTLSR